MAYIVATEGEELQDGTVLLSGRAITRSGREPRGIAHLFSDGETRTLCGQRVEDLHQFPSIPYPGNYVGLYGCPDCKQAADA